MKNIFKCFGASSSRTSQQSQHAHASASDQQPGSSPGPSSDHGSAFSALPVRPQQKAQMLESALSRYGNSADPDPGLVDYANSTLRHLQMNVEAGEGELIQKDIDNLQLIVNSYNSSYDRHPPNSSGRLNLHSFNGPSACINEITKHTGSGTALRAVVRPSDDKRHHIAVDVRCHANGTTSLISIESARAFSHVNMPPFIAMRREMATKLGGELVCAVIETTAQRSSGDCVIFALNDALAAYRHADLFDNWHTSLVNTGQIAQPSAWHDRVTDRVLPDLDIYSGFHLLPADFYKHAQSRATINELNECQPGAKDADVRSGRTATHKESLEDRLEQFRVQRGNNSHTISIEASRARKIRHALES